MKKIAIAEIVEKPIVSVRVKFANLLTLNVKTNVDVK